MWLLVVLFVVIVRNVASVPVVLLCLHSKGTGTQDCNFRTNCDMWKRLVHREGCPHTAQYPQSFNPPPYGHNESSPCTPSAFQEGSSWLLVQYTLQQAKAAMEKLQPVLNDEAFWRKGVCAQEATAWGRILMLDRRGQKVPAPALRVHSMHPTGSGSLAVGLRICGPLAEVVFHGAGSWSLLWGVFWAWE